MPRAIPLKARERRRWRLETFFGSFGSFFSFLPGRPERDSRLEIDLNGVVVFVRLGDRNVIGQQGGKLQFPLRVPLDGIVNAGAHPRLLGGFTSGEETDRKQAEQQAEGSHERTASPANDRICSQIRAPS